MQLPALSLQHKRNDIHHDFPKGTSYNEDIKPWPHPILVQSEHVEVSLVIPQQKKGLRLASLTNGKVNKPWICLSLVGKSERKLFFPNGKWYLKNGDLPWSEKST